MLIQVDLVLCLFEFSSIRGDVNFTISTVYTTNFNQVKTIETENRRRNQHKR